MYNNLFWTLKEFNLSYDNVLKTITIKEEVKMAQSFPLDEIIEIPEDKTGYIGQVIPEVSEITYNAWIASIEDPSGISNRSGYVLDPSGNKNYKKYKNRILVIGNKKPSFFDKEFGFFESLSLSEWFNLRFSPGYSYSDKDSKNSVKGNIIYLDSLSLSQCDSSFPQYYMKNFDTPIYYKYVGKVFKKKDLYKLDSKFELIKEICKIPNFIDYVIQVFSPEKYNLDIIKKISLTKDDIESAKLKANLLCSHD